MLVTDVEVIPVEIDIAPLEDGLGIAPYTSGIDDIDTVQRLLVKVETDEGITGWGETSPVPSIEVVKSFFRDIVRPDLVGRPVYETAMIGGGRSNGGARDDAYDYLFMNFDLYRGGVDVALWDALGKRLGAPLYELLGGKENNRVSLAYCLGILDPGEAAEHAQLAVDHGFGTIKTKAGRDWRADVERMIAMDEAVDGEIDFRIDPNQAYGFQDAVRMGAALEDAGVYVQYFEQPIRVETYGTYKRLRERLRQPIAVNEDMYHSHNLTNLIREDAIDCAVVDAVPAGGLLEAKQLAGTAADAGVSVAHHSSFDLGVKTAAVLHLHTSTPAINLPPDRVNYALEDDIVEEPFELQDGTFRVPEDPGLGVSVDMEKVEAHRID